MQVAFLPYQLDCLAIAFLLTAGTRFGLGEGIGTYLRVVCTVSLGGDEFHDLFDHCSSLVHAKLFK